MVPVAVPSAMTAPLGFESVTVIASLPSLRSSSMTATFTVFDVAPAAKVTVSLFAV